MTVAPSSREPDQRLNPLVELTKTRLREFFRERGLIFWVFGFPIVMAIGLGLAFRSKPPEKPFVAVIASAQNGPVNALLASQSVAAIQISEEAAMQGLARSKYALVVDARTAQPVYHYDPMRPDARLARALTDAELQQAAGRTDVLRTSDMTQSMPGTRYIDFLLPGLIGMNVMGSSIWSIGYNLVLARRRRLLRRYAVTSMRRSHFLLSYFVARLVFLGLELGVLVAFGALAFGTYVQGSFFALALTALLGAAAFAGLGLLVGARIDSTEVASGWMNFIQLPMWVLSGAFFSNERFPDWLQPFIQALPLTALVDSLRLVFNAGMDTVGVASELAILAAWIVASFAVAARTFRWQ